MLDVRCRMALCVKKPSTMKVMISISRCGCSPNPDGQRSLASLCPVHSSYIKYKRRCKLKLLCTNLIFLHLKYKFCGCLYLGLFMETCHRSDQDQDEHKTHCPPWLLVHPAPGHRSSPAEHQRRQALHCTLQS